MSAKILISGESNSGKTTLLSTLKDAFIVSHDGKNFPFPIPHTNIADFDSAEEFTVTVTDKIQAYKDRFDRLPRTVVIDSVSKVFDTLYDTCNTKYTGFNVYSNLNKQIHVITDFIQQLVDNGMNIIIISHAIWDVDNAKFNLVGKGDFQKRGGFLAEVDNSIFLETKSNKRIIHHKSTKFPARSVLDIEESQPSEKYNLQDHIEKLESLKDAVQEFIL